MSEGKWKQVNLENNNFWAKEMKYQNSCYPCSLHVILRNLGHFDRGKTEIEDSWNEMTIEATNNEDGLEKIAVPTDKISNFLINTFYKSGRIYNMPPITDENTAIEVCNCMRNEFIRKEGPAGLIIGVEHARVVYKTESGKFIYYNPSQTMSNVRATISNGISMDYVKDTQANIFAVRIHLEDGEMYAGNIITIITP